MSDNNPHYAYLIRYTGEYPFKEIVEVYDDYHCLHDRMDELWRNHRREFGIGMTLILCNRWGKERLHVGVTDAGWFLEIRKPGRPTVFVPGKVQCEEMVEFLDPKWHHGAIECIHLLQQDHAERLIGRWLDGQPLV